MFDLYSGSDTPIYLDSQAKDLFEEGRYHFRELGLADSDFIEDGGNTLIFPWSGDIAMDTLAVCLTYEGVTTEREGICLVAKGVDRADVRRMLQEMISKPEPSSYEIATKVQKKMTEKPVGLAESWFLPSVISYTWFVILVTRSNNRAFVSSGRATTGHCRAHSNSTRGIPKVVLF